MKNFKRFASVVMVIMMMLSMMIPAMAASITITPPSLDTSDTENPDKETGITYTAYKIFDATLSGETNVAYTIESTSPYYQTVADSGYFTLTLSAGSTTTYVVTANTTYTEETANTFADTLKTVTSVTAAGTFTKQDDGTYKLDDLDNGYYLVTSSVGTDLILDTIGEITVATKNAYPSQDKKVEGKDNYTTADMGEALSFTIDVTIPEDAAGEIVVHDIMTGLEYVSMTEIAGITAASTGLSDDCSVEFTLSTDYVAANKGTTITITYTAKLTADVAKNKSWIVDDTFTSKEDEVAVYSTDIVINKVIKDQTTPLADAKFVLKNSDGKFYNVDDNNNVTWVDEQSAATEVTTNDEGKAEFANIADGTYFLVETVAPAGYNLLTASVEVTVAAVPSTTKDETTGDTTTTVVDIVAKVENSSGTELPTTGGIGTTIFYCAGAILAVGAFVLLITKKRMSREM